MGSIKKEINEQVKIHGSKAKARLEAEDWYKKSLNSFRNNTVVKRPGRFVPGKIYVFRYDTPVTEDLQWWDRNPIVLALDPYKGNDVGINLNLLPTDVKETLLDDIHTTLMGQIKTATTRSPENAGTQIGLRFTYKGAKQYLDRFGFGFAVRQYIPSLKTKQATVAYEHWSKIAICDFIELEGLSIGQLRSMFRKYYNNKNI